MNLIRRGLLSDYFAGVAVTPGVAMYGSCCRSTPGKSHQHEFNGITQLCRLRGAALLKSRAMA